MINFFVKVFATIQVVGAVFLLITNPGFALFVLAIYGVIFALLWNVKI